MEPISEEILELVKKKMVEQAAFSRGEYKELVEETIEYFREKGKLTDDDNDEFIENQLMGVWKNLQNEFASRKV